MKKLILTAAFIMAGSLILFGQDAITVIQNVNVGINNTTLAAKLDVNGDVNINGNVNTDSQAINARLRLTDELSEEILRNILKHLNIVKTFMISTRLLKIKMSSMP